MDYSQKPYNTATIFTIHNYVTNCLENNKRKRARWCAQSDNVAMSRCVLSMKTGKFLLVQKADFEKLSHLSGNACQTYPGKHSNLYARRRAGIF